MKRKNGFKFILLIGVMLFIVPCIYAEESSELTITKNGRIISLKPVDPNFTNTAGFSSHSCSYLFYVTKDLDGVFQLEHCSSVEEQSAEKIPTDEGVHTYNFYYKNTKDVAFSISNAYDIKYEKVWDDRSNYYELHDYEFYFFMIPHYWVRTINNCEFFIDNNLYDN